MADITGTEGADRLTGTTDSDKILALGGDDTIVGSVGFDRVDGGGGQDTIDFSNTVTSTTGSGHTLLVDGSVFGRSTRNNPRAIQLAEYATNLSNIETIIANPNLSGNVITDGNGGLIRNGIQNARLGNADVDLSAERLTFYAAADNSSNSFTIKNFQDISLTSGNNRLKGNDLDNRISGSNGEYRAIGSKGNDSYIFYSASKSSIDYSQLGSKITIGFDSINNQIDTIDKNGFGKDTLFDSSLPSAQQIIGANNQINTIDGRKAANGYGLNINLAQNSLTITNRIGTYEVEVNNFTNAIGTKAADTIVGGNNNSRLVGNGGNDTITGGSGNDTIVGAGAGSRGVGEVDTLTGGGGKDKFVLGNTNGAYYLGNGANDYALIKDFNIFQDSLSIGSLQDYSLAGSGNTIDLYAGKDVNTRDLIAKIQLSSPLATKTTTTTKGMISANSTLGDAATVEPLSSQLNIISGDNAADIIA